MQQISRAIYLVNQGEVVRVGVRATKVGNFAVFSVDGSQPNVVNTNPLTWEFTVTVTPGNTHFGVVQVFFPTTAPDDAQFDVFVSGSGGGGVFQGSDIKKTDTIWRRGLEFRCI